MVAPAYTGSYPPAAKSLADLGATTGPRPEPIVKLARLTPARKRHFWRAYQAAEPQAAEALKQMLTADPFVAELRAAFDAEPSLPLAEFNRIMDSLPGEPE